MSGSSQTPLDPTAGDTPADGTDGQPEGRADTPHADRRGAWSARRVAVAVAAAVLVVWLIAKASES
jgi:hypothetical protein